jgi:hypothetical protein
MHELTKAYLISVPTALMVVFTYHSIIYHGEWCVNMVEHGEYYIEELMFLVWFVLFIKNIKTICK